METKRLFLHDSTEDGPRITPARRGVSRDKRNPYPRSVRLPVGYGFRSAIAAGDYVMREIVKREEFRAQHGPVRTLFKPVDQAA